MSSRHKTWGETTRQAEAMDEIISIIARYLPPDSGIKPNDALSDIIEAVEVKTGHRFIDRAIEPASAYTCQSCGQSVDRRELGDVLHHEVPGHKPIPTN